MTGSSEGREVCVIGLGNMGSALGEALLAKDHNHDDVQCRLDVHAAAFPETLAMCRVLGVDAALPAAVMNNFERADAAGHGHQEISALFEVLINDDG